MKLSRAEQGCPVAIFFVYISLATVMSSKLNIENSAKHSMSMEHILITF